MSTQNRYSRRQNVMRCIIPSRKINIRDAKSARYSFLDGAIVSQVLCALPGNHEKGTMQDARLIADMNLKGLAAFPCDTSRIQHTPKKPA